MARIIDNLIERRRYIRLAVPISISYLTPNDGRPHNVVSKNISADGIRFETRNKNLAKDDMIEISLNIASSDNPVRAKGRVVWKKRISLADASPFDVGVELTGIEEGNKNQFLKFLCDMLYNLPKENEDEKKRTRHAKD